MRYNQKPTTRLKRCNKKGVLTHWYTNTLKNRGQDMIKKLLKSINNLSYKMGRLLGQKKKD